jgi:hypothetical protein
MTVENHADPRSLSAKPAWAEVWHLWTVIIPRRSITGRLVSGRSGGGMTGVTGSTRSSLSIELSGDHGVVYYVCAHLRRRRYFCAAF